MDADERRLNQTRNRYSFGHLFSSMSLVVALLVLTVVAGVLAFDLLQITAAYVRVLLFGVRSGGGKAQSFIFHIPTWIPFIVWMISGGLLIYKEWKIGSLWLKVAINAAITLLILVLFLALLLFGLFS
ncbi:MAG: hypothetical protein AAGI37_01200 [Planctomycetota bacterium]